MYIHNTTNNQEKPHPKCALKNTKPNIYKMESKDILI